MARRDGLTALSLRALARAVGMEAQSLYTYFGSKHALYDAMFAQGNRELLDRLARQTWPEEPRAALRQLGRAFVAFSVEDQARHQLLFQNSIPDFAPSPDSYAVALQVFDHGRARLDAVGIADPAHVDLWTALIGGLAAQQLANDPGGNRWLRLVDEAVDMYVAHVVPGCGAVS
jgi:AcrR family transcriptional regulator